MKKNYFITLLFMACLLFSVIGAQADTGTGKSETVILTEKERYNEEYYKQPTTYFVAEKPAVYSSAKSTLSLEDYLVSQIESGQTTIDVSAYQIPESQAVNEYLKIINNNPQLFYVKRNKVLFNYITVDNQKIVFSYNISYIDGITEEEIAKMREELKAAVRQVVSQVDTTLDEYQQALLVHDYLVQNCEYDSDNYINDTIPDISHTAYGCLVYKIAVCDGYANAFTYIMKNMLGIPCELITSEPMEHAWNMIEINWEWYHVDVTWDDPTPDYIGRVSHEYFLLSDNKISDNSPEAETDHNHYAWAGDNKAVSTLYDNAFWETVDSAICYYNGAWYYSRWQLENDNYDEAIKLMKKEEKALLADAEEVIYNVPAFCSADGRGYYSVSFVYLSTAHNRLYFNSPTEICQLNMAGAIKTVYAPEDLSDKKLYGFTVRGNELWYAPASEPPASKQTDIRKYALPEIKGVKAEDVTGEYNGISYAIELEGLQKDDIVRYLGTDGTYQKDQPEMIETGIYEVKYQVDRDGCGTLCGQAVVTIEQAEPEYDLPTGLIGYIGDSLGSVKLPKGFSWESDSESLFEKRGNQNYLVTYVPEDTKNYKIISGIEVGVGIDCRHQYVSKLTTPPSEGEAGIETYYCKVCEDTYTSVIDESLPKLTGIAAEDITEPYTENTHLITVNGLKEGDVIQYSLPDEWYETTQPEIKEIGTYQVYYKVEREGYQPFYGMVKVTVICSEHAYTSVITKYPTETESGIRTYTCNVCGKTYTEDIDKKVPVDNGTKDAEEDTGKNTENNSKKDTEGSGKSPSQIDERIYISEFESVNSEADSIFKPPVTLKKVKISSAKRKGNNKIKLTWKKLDNVSGYEIYMKKGNGKYKKVKTISQGKTVSYTKNGLNKKYVYTFKIRAYTKIDGKKVYGAYSSSRKVK